MNKIKNLEKIEREKINQNRMQGMQYRPKINYLQNLIECFKDQDKDIIKTIFESEKEDFENALSKCLEMFDVKEEHFQELMPDNEELKEENLSWII